MPVTDVGPLADRDDDPRFNQPGVHPIHRAIRTVVDDYPGTVTVGEVWVRDRPDELHLGFNFRLTQAEFGADSIRDAIDNTLAAAATANATPTWTLANHDVGREVTRYGGGAAGLARARAMALVLLALPGAVFIYSGEELGLPDVELPDAVLPDPTWERSGHTQRGRDGCRVPMPWAGQAVPFGFSTNPDTWLPMPPQWTDLTAEKQLADAGSTLSLYRRALELRRECTEFTDSRIEWLPAPRAALIFSRGRLVCALNAGGQSLPLPDGASILTSGPLVDGKLPADTAAWLR